MKRYWYKRMKPLIKALNHGNLQQLIEKKVMTREHWINSKVAETRIRWNSYVNEIY